MTRIYNDAGEHVPVTVLRMENCQVVAQRTQEKNGYTAVQLGVGLAKVKNTSKAMRGHFATASVEPKSKLAEFRVSADNMLDVGAEITVDLVERTATIGELRVSFEIDDYTRWRLLEGLDDIGLTLRNEDRIAQFEARREAWRPRTLPVR